MIGLLGFDHLRAGLDLRGKLSFSGERLASALRVLHRSAVVDEVVILSTCNRTEVYVATDDWQTACAQVRTFLDDVYRHVGEKAAGASDDASVFDQASVGATTPRLGAATAAPAAGVAVSPELAAALYEQEEVAAARHLFRVAAGLESMVIGEPQILGQVKEALTAAESAGTVGEALRAVFVSAVKAGKRIRSQTDIGRADVSVAALAVRVADQALGGIEGKSALVIGAGRTCQLIVRLLRERNIGRLSLANRSLGAAKDLAAEVGAEAKTLDAIEGELRRVDLVVSATAAPHHVVSAATVAQAVSGRRTPGHTPLVVIDLAVPPDVEPAAGLLPNVSLLTLDTLRTLEGTQTVPMLSPVARGEAIEQAAQILVAAEHEYVRAHTVRQMVPGIAALRRHVDRSERAEMARALAQLAHLSPEDRAVVERLGQRLVDKMFHHLVSRIRSLAEFDEVPPHVTMRVLARLFADPDVPGESE